MGDIDTEVEEQEKKQEAEGSYIVAGLPFSPDIEESKEEEEAEGEEIDMPRAKKSASHNIVRCGCTLNCVLVSCNSR